MVDCTFVEKQTWPENEPTLITRCWTCPICQQDIIVDQDTMLGTVEAFFSDPKCCKTCSIYQVSPDRVIIAEGSPYIKTRVKE